MSDTNQPGSGEPGAPMPDDAATAAPGASSASNDSEVSAVQLREIIAVLQADLEAQRTEKLRLLADMENIRKRSERERVETAKYAVTKFAKDIVGVVDNFERAAAAVPAEAAEKDAALKSFLGGVVLAEREFLSVLERHGVRRIEAQGQPFNPHHHQAVMEREDATVPSGTVLQVFQAGFMLEDRCLRPAMVVVSCGGPKYAKQAESTPSGAPPDGAPPPPPGSGDEPPASADSN